MKKLSVKHPLNNVDLACLYMYLREQSYSYDRYPKAHEVRKFMYLQRHGSMKGWHRKRYCSYFQKESRTKATDGRYVNILWSNSIYGDWSLTDEGQAQAEKAYLKLKDFCHCGFQAVG